MALSTVLVFVFVIAIVIVFDIVIVSLFQASLDSYGLSKQPP